MLRAGAPRLTRQGVLVLATTADGGEQTVAVAEGAVLLTKDPALMPRLRMPLLALAMALLGARHRRRGAPPLAAPDEGPRAC